MSQPDTNTPTSQALLDASAALFTLRDALLQLSFTLKDWQFEADTTGRHSAATATHDFLERIRASRGPGTL